MHLGPKIVERDGERKEGGERLKSERAAGGVSDDTRTGGKTIRERWKDGERLEKKDR